MFDTLVSEEEIAAVKWNLNGDLIGTGNSITIPGAALLTRQKYVAEAYVSLSNSYGIGALNENDDWHFEVKDNDVISFSYRDVPKVGKTTTLEADALVFPKLSGYELLIWKTAIPHKVLNKQSIAITPAVAGRQIVHAAVNNQEGVSLSIDVKQAKITGMLFTDSNGIAIQKASWGQTVNIWLRQEYLIKEDIIIEVWDRDTFKDDFVGLLNRNNWDGSLFSFPLDSHVRKATGAKGRLYIKATCKQLKIADVPNNIYIGSINLDVEDRREIYDASIGTQDGSDRHFLLDYNQISYFYGKSRGIKPEEQLNLSVYENDEKLLEAKNVHADESGLIKIKLEWNEINPKLPSRSVYAVVTDKNGEVLYDGAKMAKGPLIIIKKSDLLGLAEYHSAVQVGTAELTPKKEEKNCVCKDYDLIWGDKFTCEERKKVIRICANLWGEHRKLEMANHLMNCMALETGESFKPDQGYSSGRAIGLVQWTTSAITGMNRNNKYNKGIELTKTKLANMTVFAQLDYVELYFKMWMDAGKIIKNALDMYMCIWCPAAVGKDDSFVCYSEENSSIYYEANKSIDGEYYIEKYTNSKEKVIRNTIGHGNKDNKITRGELKPRLKVKEVSGFNFKARLFDCKYKNESEKKSEDGVLEKMRKIADEHHIYKQETNHLRTDDTVEGREKMDCSEFVSRYLFELGLTKKPIYMTTANMMSESAFRKVIGSENIDLVKGSKEESFVPTRGDIFVWGYQGKESWNGHTGIVYEYDKIKDTVTILEAIGSSGAVSESQQVKNGGYSGKGCTRTAIYNRLGGALYGHTAWAGYYRPKNFIKEL